MNIWLGANAYESINDPPCETVEHPLYKLNDSKRPITTTSLRRTGAHGKKNMHMICVVLSACFVWVEGVADSATPSTHTNTPRTLQKFDWSTKRWRSNSGLTNSAALYGNVRCKRMSIVTAQYQNPPLKIISSQNPPLNMREGSSSARVRCCITRQPPLYAETKMALVVMILWRMISKIMIKDLIKNLQNKMTFQWRCAARSNTLADFGS